MACLTVVVVPPATETRAASGGAFDPPALEVGAPFPRLALPVISGPGGKPRFLSIEAFHGERVVVHLFAGW